jgi:hypothetical protein
MSTDIKPGQIWAWRDTDAAKGPHGTQFEIADAAPHAPDVAYRYPHAAGLNPDQTYGAPAKVIAANAVLLNASVATPAPLDPKDRHPDQLARVKAAPLDPSKVAITLKGGDYIEAESDGAKIGGKVSHVTERGFVVIEHLGEFAIHHITASPQDGYRFFILTAHQPAPKPEWKPGTVAVVIQGGDPGAGVDDHEFRAALQTDGTWVGLAGEAATAAPISVRPLVVIDPADVDVAHLAHVYDDAPGTERTGIRAVLAALGIEVAR